MRHDEANNHYLPLISIKMVVFLSICFIIIGNLLQPKRTPANFHGGTKNECCLGECLYPHDYLRTMKKTKPEPWFTVEFPLPSINSLPDNIQRCASTSRQFHLSPTIAGSFNDIVGTFSVTVNVHRNYIELLQFFNKLYSARSIEKLM